MNIEIIAAIVFILYFRFVSGFELLQAPLGSVLLDLAVADVLGGVAEGGEVFFVPLILGMASPAHAFEIRLVLAASAAELEFSGGGH